MSILIKGLKMPKGNEALVVCINSNGTIDEPNYQWDYTLIEGAEAVELPCHGDLIDRDALSASMYHEAFEIDSALQRWDSGCWIRYKMFEHKRDEAPVIIPAERSEE